MKDMLKTLAGIAISLLIAGVAGHYDRQDEEITEMKNDGTYWELSERYPGADEERLIELRDSLRGAEKRSGGRNQ